MKKLALALIAASAAVFGFGLVAQAQSYSPTVSVGTVVPGGAYSVTYTNCTPGQTILFQQPQSTPTSVTAVCSGSVSSLDEITGSVIGLLLPAQSALPTAVGNFTTAPTGPGTYNGTAGPNPNGPFLPFSITIPGQATTTAPATTVPAPTVPVTTAAPVVTTAPPLAGGLPATGSDGIGTTTGIALGLLVVGLGLFVVAQVRRRQAPTA
jgi:hypothetical protein